MALPGGEPMPWYCPKCGQVAIEKDGFWWCTSALQFSKHLGDRLTKTYSAMFIPGRRPPVGLPGVDSPWFCPACCAVVGNDVCPEGHPSLRPFVFDLIERHPHDDGHGRYF